MAKKLGQFQLRGPFGALLILVLTLAGVIIFQVVKMVPSGLEYISEEEFNKIKSEAQAAKAIIDPKKIKEEIRKIDEEIKAVPKIKPMIVPANEPPPDLEALKAKIADARANLDKEKKQVADYMAQIEELKKRIHEKTPPNSSDPDAKAPPGSTGQ
jgi:peptidoglycan hydrolase CwlO-like protein